MADITQALTPREEGLVTATVDQELEEMIFSAKHCSENGLGYDDIDLFGRLRSLTIIKGLEIPAKVSCSLCSAPGVS